MLTNSQTVRIERHELPDGLAALTFADSATALPANSNLPLIFVLHGLGSRKERHLDLCLRLASAGFLACMIDARFHGERRAAETAALEGNKQSPEFVQAFGATIRGTVEDFRSLADYFGRSRYGIIGHSMGGFIATHTALADPRASIIVNVAGSIDFRPPPGLGIPPAIAALASEIDAASRADALWPAAVLLIHGDQDETVPIAGAKRLYETARPAYAAGPSRLEMDILPGVGHEWIPAMAERAVAWMTRFQGEILDAAA